VSRKLPEWVGKHDDAAIPPRVMVRVFQKDGGKCAQCTRVLLPGKWACDHIVPLIAGGRNAEDNLQALCVSPCHAEKTKADTKEKSQTYRILAKYIGAKRKGRPMFGSRASGWSRGFDGRIRRRTPTEGKK
jgi:5-methylcytosine-specific restriction protein A